LNDKTSRAADKILQKNEGRDRVVYGIQTNTHIKPIEITSAINTKLREEKDGEQEMWKSLLAKARYEMPAASE